MAVPYYIKKYFAELWFVVQEMVQDLELEPFFTEF